MSNLHQIEHRVVPAADRINKDGLDIDALKVVRRLHHFDYETYVVGGAVRDLWLGRTPKDFDLATAASPRQVKRAFSNCRLIGRRFRLAHVFFGPKNIEVSTFRANVVAGENEEGEDLLVWDDNTFGNAEEDAFRRDFTINGLFYDPETHEVIDYVGGIADLDAGIIRTIGDPDIRFREDPVRILRAVKFAARLGFTIEPETFEAALRHCSEIMRCSQARVQEEVLRLLASGNARAAIQIMDDMGLLEHLLPDIAAYLRKADEQGKTLLWGFLDSLDSHDRERTPLSTGLVVGTAFAPLIFERMDDAAHGELDYGTRIDRVIGSITGCLPIPRRESALLKQILIARRRLQRMEEGRRRRGSLAKMRGKAYFPAAVLFCELELAARGADAQKVAQWRASLGVGEEVLAEMPAPPKPRRRRRRRPAGAAAPKGDSSS